MISISQEALVHAQQLMRDEQCPDGTFIRVGVEGGGCSV